MAQYIYQDLNVRDPFVSTSTEFLLHDEKVVVQSIWRLITTEEGEIPNFRVYGLSIKRFSQYPLTPETIKMVYNYVKNKVRTFEERGEIVRADVDVDIEHEQVFYSYYVRIKSTQTVLKLPIWTLNLGGQRTLNVV